MSNEWFKNWFNTTYYHDLYFKRNEEEANLFIRNLTEKLQIKKNDRILDVACGKGRHAIQLNKLGYNVIGIDYSEYFISEAKKHENDHLQFFVQDMRQPYWVNYFDLVVNLFTSFGYFDTKREHITSLRNMYNALKPGAIFVIDYLNILKAEKNLVPNNHLIINKVKYTIHKTVNHTHFLKTIEIEDGERKFMYKEQVAKFDKSLFIEMLNEVGFSIENIYGNYALELFDEENSDRLIIVAKK